MSNRDRIVTILKEDVIAHAIETAGLDPFKHKVLTIQLKKAGGDLRIWKIWQEKDETSMISARYALNTRRKKVEECVSTLTRRNTRFL